MRDAFANKKTAGPRSAAVPRLIAADLLIRYADQFFRPFFSLRFIIHTEKTAARNAPANFVIIYGAI